MQITELFLMVISITAISKSQVLPILVQWFYCIHRWKFFIESLLTLLERSTITATRKLTLLTMNPDLAGTARVIKQTTAYTTQISQ